MTYNKEMAQQNKQAHELAKIYLAELGWSPETESQGRQKAVIEAVAGKIKNNELVMSDSRIRSQVTKVMATMRGESRQKHSLNKFEKLKKLYPVGTVIQVRNRATLQLEAGIIEIHLADDGYSMDMIVMLDSGPVRISSRYLALDGSGEL